MPAATFLFADGERLSVPVEPGKTVLEAAIAIDAPIRYDCASGTCGACIAECVTGVAEGQLGPLTADEYADGLRATCQTRLSTDAEFQLPYPLSPAPSAQQRFKGRVVEVDLAAVNVHRLVVELQGAEDLVFQSGQYMRLRPPGLKAARAYSLASAPADLPRAEFLIRHVEGGGVTTWLKGQAKIGDAVTMMGPLGAFGLEQRAHRHVFIAGGTGLAPVLSMLRTLPVNDSALLCFGCTRADDLFYVAELNALRDANPGVEIRVALMAAENSAYASGTAVSLLSEADLADESAYFYLCGPPPMVDAARTRLAASVPARRIRAERFAPGG